MKTLWEDYARMADDALTPPLEAWKVVDAELSRFSADLGRRPRLLAASKCESPGAQERARELEAASGLRVWRTSSASRL